MSACPKRDGVCVVPLHSRHRGTLFCAPLFVRMELPCMRLTNFDQVDISWFLAHCSFNMLKGKSICMFHLSMLSCYTKEDTQKIVFFFLFF